MNYPLLFSTKITEWKTFAASLSQRIEPHHITEIQANESTISERKLALYMKWLQVCQMPNGQM